MKSVLISIQPKWCELIASGKKTIEVRRTRPNIEVPFKAYVYETKAQFVKSVRGACTKYGYGRGKVIGEFICDKVEEYNTSWIDGEDRLKEYTCLNDVEIMDYMHNYTDRKFYGWHITDLKIYDNPKELGFFRKPCTVSCMEQGNIKGDCGTCGELRTVICPPQSWMFVEELL